MRRLGFEVLPYDAEHFRDLRRPALLRDRQIDLVLDVGANNGRWAEELQQSGYTGRIVSFEPMAAAFSDLQRRSAAVSNWEVLQIALGNKAGAAPFHVAGNSSSSSLLPMAGRHVVTAPDSAYVAEEQVEVRRLDDLAPDVIRPGERIWLKIDVQGSELPALRGAEKTLGSVEVVETELSLVELYEGQALFGEVVAFLGSCGFGARYLEPIFSDPASGEVLQVDGIFTRRA
jgi:FkbM family methyltransferase